MINVEEEVEKEISPQGTENSKRKTKIK